MRSRSVLQVCTALMTLSGLTLTGCTSISVKAVAAEHRIEHICIQNNPRVTVSDFVPVMQEGFQAHGISSKVVANPVGAECLFTAIYTARRSWDMATYLSEAQIDILRDGRNIASANYHLKGKGGLSLNKWVGTRTKILPVIDQLLAQVKPGNRQVSSDASALFEKVSLNNEQSSPELSKRLSDLKDAFDAGLITREEYDAKRKSLIETF